MKFFLSKKVVSVGLVIILLSTILTACWTNTQGSGKSAPTLTASQLQSEFVTHSGSQLLLGDKPFHFAGPNIYWLGLDGNEGGVTYPSHFRVDDALATAQAMGATVVRAHTLGISVGCSLCVEPKLGMFNETALQHIDYAIKAAHDHSIRLITPLIDNWRYYHGGIHVFTDWRGLPVTYYFYSNPTVISDFEQYISHLLNHVNTYTGIAYKNDPTIMAWETGNEITPTTRWTKTISEYIKSIDSHHLVIDGTKGVDAGALALNSVDIISDHFYPISNVLLDADVQTAVNRHKVFIVGEFDWTGTQGGDSLTSFIADVEHNKGVSGDLYWALFAHNDNYGYEADDSGYSLHYPGGTPDRRARVQELRAHAYTMSGRSVPAYPAPGTPLITSVTKNKIAWRGTTIAVTYSVERSTTGANGTWSVICNQCASDEATPWTDTSKPSGHVWYRVRAYNLSGVAGPYSPVFEA